MPKRAETPPVKRRPQSEHQCAVGLGRGGGGGSLETEYISRRSSSPLLRRCRFSSAPVVEIRHGETEMLRFPASVELPRRHVTFYADSDSESSHSGGGLCSMSDVLDSCKDSGGGGSPITQPSVRMKHLSGKKSEEASRFPKLDECAHFHYDNVELGPIDVSLCDDRPEQSSKATPANDSANSSASPGELWFCVRISSNGKSWDVKRSLDNFVMLDTQLHRCVFERKFSGLRDLSVTASEVTTLDEDGVRGLLTVYLERFSQLAGSLINCGPVLNWLELDNRGYRLIVTDEAAINTPAVAAAYVIKRYAAQANDEIPLEVGDIISVIDMPPPEESTWWRGKKGFQVGFFPCDCVDIIGDKVPKTIQIPKVPAKPVLRKHGKLIAFFRQFLLSRPSRRKLKQSGILKERVFGCDLGEHLMNSGRDIPLVLKCCAEFIEEYGIVDGIYRLSGITSNIQKLRLAFDEDRAPNLMDEAILQDIHSVASLLKMYFRELPNPLLTFHLYDKFVSAVQADEDIRLLKLRDVVQQLPPPHYRSLEYLMRHLSTVAAHGSQTGMTPKNVAIVWAPNLLRSREIENGGVGALHVVGVQAVLTEYLIRYTDLIFNPKMPAFPSPIPCDESPKKTRPKSLAISTPTKLLSLEEARSRALASNLPTAQPKFIDVGGGADSLPTKYHTVIDIPCRRSGGKGKKSPSGWKSFFSRGWHTSSGRSKARRSHKTSGQRPKISSPIFVQNSPLSSQDKALTEMEVAHTNPKKLRTVKSAESLLLTTVLTSQCANSHDPSVPGAESKLSSQPESSEYLPPQDTLSCSSPSKSPGYQKHMRSTSHDSYFENVMEFDGCQDPQDATFQQPKTSPVEEAMSDDFSDKQAVSYECTTESVVQVEVQTDGATPSSSKTSQKQKLVCFETEASSPKLQKLSLKRLYNTLSSPPIIRRLAGGNALEENSKGCKSRRTQSLDKEAASKIFAARNAPGNMRSKSSSVAQSQSCSSYSLPPDGNAYAVKEAERSEGESSGHLSSGDEGPSEVTDGLTNLSMEATLSGTISVSQLMSFESNNGDSNWDQERVPPHGPFHSVGLECSAITPDSPTIDNISEMPSSTGSEFSSSPHDAQSIEKQLSASWPTDKFGFGDATKKPKGEKIGENYTNDNTSSSPKAYERIKNPVCDDGEILVEKTNSLQIESNLPVTTVSPETSHQPPVAGSVFFDDENAVLSPPANFHNHNPDYSKATRDARESISTGSRRSSTGSRGRSMGRSKTEVLEICPRFVSGIAMSGSFGQQQFNAATQDMSESLWPHKRRGNDRLSPMSPVEESKRRFESEIGRLIVRDRQMRHEMEQMKAERQKCKPKLETTPKITAVIPPFKGERCKEQTEVRRSPVKKKTLDSEDTFIVPRDNQETKRAAEWSFDYPQYLRMENKPSVKELLTRFEVSQKTDSDMKSVEIFGSPPKGKGSTFLNVQVINHEASSRESSVDFHNSLKSFENLQSRQNRDHIFQTECVVRFPHPKATSLISSQVTAVETKASSCSSCFLNSYLRSRDDTKQDGSTNNSKVTLPGHALVGVAGNSNHVFNSNEKYCDGLSHASGPYDGSSKLEDFLVDQTRLGVSSLASSAEVNEGVSACLSQSLGRTTSSDETECKPSVKLKKEFLQSFAQAPEEEPHTQSRFNGRSGPLRREDMSSRNSSRQQRHSPAKQRPRSVPPPVCRLSLTSMTGQRAMNTSVADTASSSHSEYKKVPKTSGESSPPKRIRERAAMFERSLSFSGYVDRKRFVIGSTSQRSKEGETQYPLGNTPVTKQ